MSLTFIVPCYNAEETIRETLASIFSQVTDSPFEVIVVDNGSTDRSIEVARTFPVTLLIEMRRGANHARNRGASEAAGKFIAFIDADVVLEPAWAQTLLTYMTKYSLAGATGKIHRSPLRDPESLVEKYRALSQDHAVKGMSLVTPELNIGFINTAACMYMAEIFSAVEGFSETLRFHEDVDLTYKLRNLPGISLGCSSAAVARVYYSGNLITYLRRAFTYGYYYAFLEKKWALKKKTAARARAASALLRNFEVVLNFVRKTGETFGSIRLAVFPSAGFFRECVKWKRICALSRLGPGLVYYDDSQLAPISQEKTV